MTATELFGDLVESPENEREISDESIETLVGTLDREEVVIDVWYNENDAPEIIDGHRRYTALKRQGVNDSAYVEVNVIDADNRRAALLENIQRDENTKDLTPMEQARKWARYVEIDVDGETMTYREYVNNLCGTGHMEELTVPSQNKGSVAEISNHIDQSAYTVSRRLSYLLYPEDLQEKIDSGDFTQTVARVIAKRIASGVDDPDLALKLIKRIGREETGESGRHGDTDITDKMNNHIEYVNTFDGIPPEGTDVAAALSSSDEVEVEAEEPSDDGETITIEVSRDAAETIEQAARENNTSTAEVMDTVTATTRKATPSENGETQMAEIEEVPDASGDTYAPASIHDELTEEQRDRFDRIDAEHEAILNHETSVELAELKDNWDAYGHAINHIDRATCPAPDCDHGIDHLTWDCHGYDLREAFLESQRVYQQAVDDAPPIDEIIEEGEVEQ